MIATEKSSITRISHPSKQEFLNLWKQGQAFIINDVANQWDAYKNWSNSYLTDVCGDNLVPVEAYNQTFFQNYNFAAADYYHARKQMKFKDYINIVQGNQQDDNLSYYMAQVDFLKHFPELVKDIVYPKFFEKKPKVMYFFFGFANKKSTSKTYLHFDDVHNIFVQIRGRKKFILFPPSNYLSFYPPIRENGFSPAWSKVNPVVPDLKSYPEFPWQDKIEVVLEAGEILYIPPLWWHHVTAVEENISLTFWYPPSIKDLFAQKGFLPTLLQIAPYVIPYQIRQNLRKS
ncbi:transcription factor jumonji jmjC domain protein [Calothrix sp. NIES-2100]|uniref:cupin-like domain-containing protein n=1 Tax=Calothrix sp. NIES-2100 TaxID=1954172 RepID=UPI000B5F64D2|nr:transcription factor jumonji jmjC domain protein [Calothrix sp. NIES-2100]